MEVEFVIRGQLDNFNWFVYKQNKIIVSVCKDVFFYMNNFRVKILINLIKRIMIKGIIYR